MRVILLIVVMLVPISVSADDCGLSHERLLADWTADSPGQWYTRRALGAWSTTWAGGEYLWLNDGNGVMVWSLANQAAPRLLWRLRMACPAGCWAGLDGDNDHQLLGVSMCDDCPYGLASFGVMGAVVFSFIDGPQPRVGSFHWYPARQWSTGGLVWKRGTKSMLVAALNRDCGGRAGLYRIRAANDLKLVQCLQTGVTPMLTVSGGLELPGYVYLGDYMGSLQVFRIEPGPRLSWVRTFERGSWGYGAGPGYDGDEALLALADGVSSGNLRLYDVLDPSAPVLASQLSVPTPGRMLNRSSLRGSVLWAAAQASTMATTFRIDRPDHPAPLDPAWWPGPPYDRMQDWAAVVSEDEKHLYSARYSIFQQIGVDCPPPEPPLFSDGFESGDVLIWSGSSHNRGSS